MKNKTFTFIASATLFVASMSFMSINANAQSFKIATSIQDVVLDPADLSGNYVIQVPTGEYLTTDNNIESLEASSNPDVKCVIQLAKTPNGTYYIQDGDRKANYNTNGWNIVFDNVATTNNEWIINVVDAATGKITLQKNATSYTKCELARGRYRIYSDGGLANAATFTLKKALTFTTINQPVVGNYTTISETLPTDPTADLSGKYLIQNGTNGYMTPFLATASDISLVTSATPSYAFDLAKQTDGTYTVTCEGFQLVYLHGWLVNTDYLPTTLNKWTVTVGTDNLVTFQRANDGKYLKCDLNGGSYKYYSDAAATANVKYSLLKVTTITTANTTVSNSGIKCTAFQSANQLIVTNTASLKEVTVYNMNGQKVYGANVNASELSIPVNSWSKGIYMVRLTDSKGENKNIKTRVY